MGVVNGADNRQFVGDLGDFGNELGEPETGDRRLDGGEGSADGVAGEGLGIDEVDVALRAIPHPFDQAILGADDSQGRVALRTAIEALERQAEALTFLGHALGYELPVRPGN